MNLKESIKNIINSYKGDIAIVVKGLNFNLDLCINEQRIFSSASTIKLAIMYEVMTQVFEGKRKFKEKFILRGIDKCSGDGILKELIDGHLFTLEELTTLMIIASDNTATNMLIDKLGIVGINDMIYKLGAKNTKLQRKMMDVYAMDNGKDNITTAKDLSIILEQIYNGKFLNDEYKNMMIDILKRQQIKDRLQLYLPEDVIIAHKTGALKGLEHDVGIVYTPYGEYIICVLTENLSSNNEGREIIGKISKEIYDSVKLFNR